MNKSQKNIGKIRRGPKLEGCTFANFGNSSETEGESRPFKKKWKKVFAGQKGFFVGNTFGRSHHTVDSQRNEKTVV